MKTPHDPRHLKRIELMKYLFSLSFQNARINKNIQFIVNHLNTIDLYIQKAASEWPIDKISKIDLAILRLAIYELLIEKSQPNKVIIDEAIELAKEYGNEKSSSFINGVLGTIIKDQNVI